MRPAHLMIALAGFARLGAQTPCVNGFAGTYPCQNIDLIGFMNLTQLGTVTSSADVWGWTDPLTNKEYAVVGTRTGTAFVDLTVPTAPVKIGFLPTHNGTGSLWRDVDVSGNWCYVGSEISGHGIQVFDLTRLRTYSTPSIPLTEDAWFGGPGLVGNSHTIYADKDHPYVYAVGTGVNSGGLNAINVSNPLAPTLAGTYTINGYIHENMVITYAGPDVSHVGEQISFNFHGNGANKISIVNVTDKTDMDVISTINYPNSVYAHQGWVTEDHRFLLMDDEQDEVNQGINTRTRIFNIENLEVPVQLASYYGPNPSSDHNLYVHRQLVFESNYTSGLRILDATNIATGPLTEAAYFDTYPAGNANGYTGCWGNYPFFASGLIVATGINEGLFILRPRLSLRVKALLEGPFDANSGLMHDSLRVKGLLPLAEPYTALGYVHVGGGGETTTNAVLSVTGANAVIDWVEVELRDATDPTIVRATRSALIQRDGDIVGTDGVSPVQFSIAVNDYHIAVRHRNHLGVMTDEPVRVSVALKTYDLTNGSVALFGTEAAKTVGGKEVLWMGNVFRDDHVAYTGAENDRDPILVRVGSTSPNNTVVGYHLDDATMDGRVKYTGPLNDRDPILVNVGGSVPNNTRAEQLP